MKTVNSSTILLPVLIGFLLFCISFSSCDFIEDIFGNDNSSSTNYGDTLWIHTIPGDSLFADISLAIGKDGSLYFAKGGGTATWARLIVVALNGSTGQVKWQSQPLDYFGLSSQIVVGDNGNLYAIGQYKLYSISPGNGQFNWEWTVPVKLPNPNGAGEVYTYGQIGALALMDNGDPLLGSIGAGSYYRGLYCIKPDGTMKWHNLKAIGGSIRSGIVIGKNNMLFYYTELNGISSLVVVNGNTGVIDWSIPAYNSGSSSNNLMVTDDGHIVGSFALKSGDPLYLHRIDPASGKILWTSSSQSTSGNTLMGTDGAFYQYFQYEGGINRLDPSSGIRRVFVQNLISDKIGAVNNNNQLLIVQDLSGKTTLSTINADGKTDWKVQSNGLLREPIVISNDKIIYGIVNTHPVSRLPKKIIALKGNAPLAWTGWPRVAHDNRNTSNVNKH